MLNPVLERNLEHHETIHDAELEKRSAQKPLKNSVLGKTLETTSTDTTTTMKDWSVNVLCHRTPTKMRNGNVNDLLHRQLLE